ncbi:MAG: leucine-rich repeat domain-containing protein [Ruminococcus sp.]|nr:leucine-rich repeat domain-containing protein [Ruminococcus sp.]
MKKRLTGILTSLVLVFGIFGAVPASASSIITSGYYKYTIYQNGAIQIVDYTGPSSGLKYTVPASIDGRKVIAIGEEAFEGCDFASITIPNGIKHIYYGAFSACMYATSISIPSSVTFIDNYAFDSCRSIKSITIPGSVKKLGDSAFGYCASLTKVSLKSGIQEIGKLAFEDCYSLKSVVVPNSVKNIGSYAFGFYYNDYSKTEDKISGFKLYGSKGSVAQSYAGFFGVAFGVVVATTPANCTGFKVAAVSVKAVKLTCNKVAGATGYVFYRAKAGKWVRVGVRKTNSFYEGNLASGTSYRYAVKAYRTVKGKNYYSKSYPTLWTSTKPGTVNFTVTPGVGKVALKWGKVRGATEYIGYIKFSANGSWNNLVETKFTNMTVSGLTRGQTYWFTIKAVRTAHGKNYCGAFVTKSAKSK